jgi:hypothetical protein
LESIQPKRFLAAALSLSDYATDQKTAILLELFYYALT